MRSLAFIRNVLPSLLLALLFTACTQGSVAELRTDAPEASGTLAPPDTSLHEFELPNGLTLSVREDPGSPLVAIVTRVGSGYLQETPAQSGWSHLLEHMILRGTKSHPGPNDLDSLVASMGGEINAATTYDHSESFLVVPTAQLQPALSLAAEIYQEPLIDPNVLQREKQAVRLEIEQKLEDPIAHARDALLQQIFSRNPMGRGQSESLDSLDSVDRDALLAFHEDQYRPANTVLSVVGDVEADSVFQSVKALFGGVSRGELRRHDGLDEPAPTALRFTREVGSYDPNVVMVGFPLSVASSRDLRSLEVLSEILVNGNSSRLKLPLQVQRDLIEDCSSQVVFNSGSGLFEVVMQAPTKADDQALRTLFVELDQIHRFGVLKEELAAAQMRLKNRWWLRRQDVLSAARLQAAREGVQGSESSPYDWDKVDSKSIQDAITRWLQIPRASVVELLNETTSRARPFYMRLDAEAMQEHLRGAVLAAAEHGQALVVPAPPPSWYSRLALGGWARVFAHPAGEQGVHRYQFDNGAVLVVDANHHSQMTSVSLRFRGGRVAEVRNTAGLTGVLQKLMIEESITRDPVSLAQELDGLGSSVVQLRDLDSFGFKMAVQGANMPYAFDILYDLVAHTPLDGQRFLKILNAQGRELHRESYRLFDTTSQLVRAAAWGENGYGIADLGTLKSLSMATPSRLQDLYAETCNPRNAVIVVSGDLDPEDVREFLDLYMRKWSDASDLYPAGADAYFDSELIEPLPQIEPGAVEEVHRADPIAALQIGFPAPGLRDSLASSFRVFSAWMSGSESPIRSALGGAGSSHLVYIHDQEGALGGLFCVYSACASKDLESTQQKIVDATRAAARAPLSEQKLESAKSILKTRFYLEQQTLTGREDFLAQREIIGLATEAPMAHAAEYDAVSLDSVRSLADRLASAPYAVGRVNGIVEANGPDSASKQTQLK